MIFCRRRAEVVRNLWNIFPDLFMVERVIWKYKEEKFLHECMIRFQLKTLENSVKFYKDEE